MLYIYIKFMKISLMVLKLSSGFEFNYKWANLRKNLGGITVLMVLVYCTPSDDAFYLYQSS